MIRELMMRYGRGNIGFLWLIVEPMILCGGVIGLRWMIQEHQEHGVPLVALLLSGYMPLTLWRHLTNRGIFLLRRNMGMLYHTNITMLDTFLMSMCLEFAGCTFAFMVNYGALVLVGAVDPIENYGLVIGGWCLMGILARSLPTINQDILIPWIEGKSNAEFIVVSSERFIQPLQYLILPISGFFFMVGWLPDSIQQWAWYMPVIHCFELTRDGFFGDAVPTHYTVAYPLILGVGWIPKRSATPSTALVPQRKVGFPIPNAGLLLGFQGTKTARREGISSPFSGAGVCTSRQNSGRRAGQGDQFRLRRPVENPRPGGVRIVFAGQRRRDPFFDQSTPGAADIVDAGVQRRRDRAVAPTFARLRHVRLQQDARLRQRLCRMLARADHRLQPFALLGAQLHHIFLDRDLPARHESPPPPHRRDRDSEKHCRFNDAGD